MHGDFAWVTASRFIRFDYNGGTNPEQPDRGGDQAEGAHNEREKDPADVASGTVQRHSQDHGTDVLSSG